MWIFFFLHKKDVNFIGMLQNFQALLTISWLFSVKSYISKEDVKPNIKRFLAEKFWGKDVFLNGIFLFDFLPWEELGILRSRPREWFTTEWSEGGTAPPALSCERLGSPQWHWRRFREPATENRGCSRNPPGVWTMWYLSAAGWRPLLTSWKWQHAYDKAG